MKSAGTAKVPDAGRLQSSRSEAHLAPELAPDTLGRANIGRYEMPTAMPVKPIKWDELVSCCTGRDGAVRISRPVP
jgi:hypothetical protein